MEESSRNGKVPSKQAVREFMQRRAVAKEPPPPIEEVRRQLGWHFIVPAPTRKSAD